MVDYVVPGMIDSSAGAMSNRNKIINGAMQIWQRGTSFSGTGVYTSDRWATNQGSGVTASQSIDVPANFKYSLYVSGTNYTSVIQKIESVNTQDLSGATITVSFWLKHSVGTGSFTVNMYYPTASDNYTTTTFIASNNITSTSSWAYYTTTFTGLPSGVLNGLLVQFFGNTSTTSTFYITGVQLERGSVATAFEYRNYQQEFAMCQRYYQTYNNNGGLRGAFNSTTSVGRAGITLPVVMRSSPTVSISGSFFAYNGTQVVSGITTLTNSFSTPFSIEFDTGNGTSGTATSGTPGIFYINGSGGTVNATAEL